MNNRTLSTDIVNKDRGFRPWGPDELYDVTKGTGFLPNDGDLVKNLARRGWDEIYEVDYTRYVWKTRPWDSAPVYNEVGILGGINPLKSDEFRVYVDDKQHPAVMRFHDALTINSPDGAFIRVFRGVDTGPDGEVISGYYEGGTIRSADIPLLTISKPDATHDVKIPATGMCTAAVGHGELISFVVYTRSMIPIVEARCHVIKTNLIMGSDAPVRQITNVRLKSPFILDVDSSVLALPINMALDDVALTCVIQYTDGDLELPIDNNRVKLAGLRNAAAHDTFYIASNAGQTLPLVLSYKMSKNEAYTGDDVSEGTIFKRYKATTEAVDGAYSIKLYVVPEWKGVGQGYRLRYYLYNLDRGNFYEATAHVKHVSGSEPFDPHLLNVKQRMNVQVDVSKVNPIYKPHIHGQSFHITLLSEATVNEPNFVIEYVHDGLKYGEENIAKFEYSNVNFSTLDISCGKASMAEWIQSMFFDAHPLYNRRQEPAAPTPTHFELEIDGNSYMHPVTAWNQKLQVDFRIDDASTVIFRWIKRNSTDTYQLGLTSTIAHQK